LPKSEAAPQPWRTLLCFESKDEKCKQWLPGSSAYKLSGGFENEDELSNDLAVGLLALLPR
jgi:hypothetical protein